MSGWDEVVLGSTSIQTLNGAKKKKAKIKIIVQLGGCVPVEGHFVQVNLKVIELVNMIIKNLVI